VLVIFATARLVGKEPPAAALRGRDQERTQRSGDTMPRERELLFRLSYPLPYEDEIRSVEGPDVIRGGPEGTAPTSAPESSLSPHPPGGRTGL